MTNTLRSGVLMATLASACLSGSAHAGDFYAGLSLTTPGEATATFKNGATATNYNTPHATKLYGGIALDERYGVEAGYGFFGTWEMADPTQGSTDRASASSRLVYAAGRARMPLGESLSLVGKLGVAANRISTEFNTQKSGSYSFVRPMVGIGADYAFTSHVSGVLEFNYYGRSAGYTQQKLELGLKYGF